MSAIALMIAPFAVAGLVYVGIWAGCILYLILTESR